MKQLKEEAARQIPQINDELWKQYKQIGQAARRIDALKDAADVRKEKPRSAPLDLLPMVF